MKTRVGYVQYSATETYTANASVTGAAKPRTVDAVLGDALSALADCRRELSYLIEQTGAHEGGAVWNACAKADAVLRSANKSLSSQEPHNKETG